MAYEKFYPLLIVGILIGRSRKTFLFPEEIECDMLDRFLQEELEEELK